MKMAYFPLLLLLLAAACAPRLEGSYVDVTGTPVFKLSGGNYVQPVRASRPLPYKVDGSLLIVGSGRQRATFTILPGGALELTRNGQVFTVAAR